MPHRYSLPAPAPRARLSFHRLALCWVPLTTLAAPAGAAGIIANIVLMAVDSDKAGMHGGIIGGLCGAVAGCSYYVNKMRDEVGEGAGTLIFWTVLLTLNLAGKCPPIPLPPI